MRNLDGKKRESKSWIGTCVLTTSLVRCLTRLGRLSKFLLSYIEQRFYFIFFFFCFQVQKVLVESRMVPCINAKPYVYSELLMTLHDLVQHFFPNSPVVAVQKILQEVLNVNLYRGNRYAIRFQKKRYSPFRLLI